MDIFFEWIDVEDTYPYNHRLRAYDLCNLNAFKAEVVANATVVILRFGNMKGANSICFGTNDFIVISNQVDECRVLISHSSRH